ncbi:MAG: DUF3955 domain-containing protein [Erysipelotrichaceae bacterium]|uniref:helix-turn-helix domain-containing protein n=1 Tax=Floccifex sp. TaxID=2815810 RepID=UPI002A74CCB4|nr:DUF3955 domain-containing protein [Floccifex sp.]MDD7280744.1 DUF3955 domain-containing protein [Erysipelotrichaceae bacterium]MDY2957605.1 DUF3955 domain-containing protein [Floccifex sp.]
MEFAKQIKQIRKENNLTQEQMAKKLNVTRQAISNWENNKNLPDLELIVLISKEFSVSLDELILEENNMTTKLIKDGSETRRTKMNLIMVIIGVVLLCIGTLCLIIKGLSVEYIDANGILHENFFLVPIGFLFILSGTMIFFITGIKNIIHRIKN